MHIFVQKKMPALELSLFMQNFAYRVPNFSVYVVFINSGLTNGSWYLFIRFLLHWQLFSCLLMFLCSNFESKRHNFAKKYVDTCEIQNCCVYYQRAGIIVFWRGEWTDNRKLKKNNHTLKINRKEKYFMAGCYALLIFPIM